MLLAKRQKEKKLVKSLDKQKSFLKATWWYRLHAVNKKERQEATATKTMTKTTTNRNSFLKAVIYGVTRTRGVPPSIPRWMNEFKKKAAWVTRRLPPNTALTLLAENCTKNVLALKHARQRQNQSTKRKMHDFLFLGAQIREVLASINFTRPIKNDPL